jgi:hypothetical protein
MMDVVRSVLEEVGLTERDAAREFAHLIASQKLADFAQECKTFERKYGMSFAEFEKKLRSREDEVFEEEDDYLVWKFASEGRAFWREKLSLLQRLP